MKHIGAPAGKHFLQSSSTTPQSQRCSVLKGKSSLALLYTVDGARALLSPRAAHARGVALQVLTASERDTLEAIGEVLVPGATAAGLAEYVDHQLTVEPSDCLLAARVLDIRPLAVDFYRDALANIDVSARHRFDQPFKALQIADQVEFVKFMSSNDPDGWQGLPAPVVFCLLRNDAADVYYGTLEGYERHGGLISQLLPGTIG